VIQSEVCHLVVPLEMEMMDRAQMALSVPRAKRKVVGGFANCAEARICGQMVPWQAEGGWFEEEGKVVGVPNAGWGWEEGGRVVVVGGVTCSAVEEEDLDCFRGFC